MNKPWDCPCTVVYDVDATNPRVDKPEPDCRTCKGTGYDRRVKASRRKQRKRLSRRKSKR